MKHVKESKLKLKAGHTSDIITEDMLIQLGSKLSPLLRVREWDVVFRTHVDGVSFHTFYKNVASCNPTIIFVQDITNTVFGAFASETWQPCSHFYGTGESFLFSFKVAFYRSQT